MATPLKNLTDAAYLTVDINSHGAYIQVDTTVYSLLAVHIAMAELLLSRKPGLRRGLQHDNELVLFVRVAAEAYNQSDASVKQVLLAFATEWNMKDQVLTHARSLQEAHG